jgi:hypothetical protein
MASELELEIQQHLLRYLDGSEERHEFENWLIPTLWDLAESRDEASRELAGHIHNLIAETSNGDRSEESLQEELTRIVRPFGAKEPTRQQAKPCVIVEPQEMELDLRPIRKPPQGSRYRSLDSIEELSLTYHG